MNILLADDDQGVRLSLTNFLKKLGHDVVCAANGQDALSRFREGKHEVVLTDLRMPVMDGLKLLEQIKSHDHAMTDVIIITGHADLESAIQALRAGAYDYLKKPINVNELEIILDRITEYRALREGNKRLKKELNEQKSRGDFLRDEASRLRAVYFKEIGLDNICVNSDAMRKVLSLAEKYSRDRYMPVLIEGETGTGKELIARYIHFFNEGPELSPFIAINCGAVSPTLFEGEFFGHDKGAYTGATVSGQKGKLEAAHGGTLFLDEIGEMPVDLQVKLLRVLESHRFYRLGGNHEIPIDIRLISATNKNLQSETCAHRFREDLFYRINAGYIRIPPLRERKEDILPLALNFASQTCLREGRAFDGFEKSVANRLNSYDWPGNVRQLKNCIRRALLLNANGEVTLKDISFLDNREESRLVRNSAEDGEFGEDCRLPEDKLDLNEWNKRIIKLALEKHNENQTATALYLGISRRVLQGYLKKFGPS